MLHLSIPHNRRDGVCGDIRGHIGCEILHIDGGRIGQIPHEHGGIGGGGGHSGGHGRVKRERIDGCMVLPPLAAAAVYGCIGVSAQ